VYELCQAQWFLPVMSVLQAARSVKYTAFCCSASGLRTPRWDSTGGADTRKVSVFVSSCVGRTVGQTDTLLSTFIK
jgi:hypothetical protein